MCVGTGLPIRSSMSAQQTIFLTRRMRMRCASDSALTAHLLVRPIRLDTWLTYLQPEDPRADSWVVRRPLALTASTVHLQNTCGYIYTFIFCRLHDALLTPLDAQDTLDCYLDSWTPRDTRLLDFTYYCWLYSHLWLSLHLAVLEHKKDWNMDMATPRVSTAWVIETIFYSKFISLFTSGFNMPGMVSRVTYLDRHLTEGCLGFTLREAGSLTSWPGPCWW